MRRSARATAVRVAAALFIASTVLLQNQAAVAAADTAVQDIPPSPDYVIDTANVVDPGQRRDMDGWLQELQEKTKAQVKVLTVRNTSGEDFFTFVERQFEHWKLGERGKDNGALIALDVGDHKIRIHTGYGLEAALPDSWCGSLSREAVSTYFKAGRYSAGIDYVVRAVAFRVAQQSGVTLSGIPEQVHHPAQEAQAPAWIGIVIVLVILVMLYFGSRNSGGGPRQGSRIGQSGMGLPWIGSGWGSSGGSGWGGSFGGGSIGGGTFGGGSFGGGGSTGGGGGGASW